jgi:hypothetical protein
MCLAWTAVGTSRASAPILLSLVPFAALGAALPGHPFDAIYTLLFRRWRGGPALPSYPLPRRFACLLATVMLVAEATSFQIGHAMAGYALGSLPVATALVNVTTGFCIPSFVYGLIFGRPSGCATQPATPSNLISRANGPKQVPASD